MNIVRKPIYPNTNNICNNRNVHEYTPYILCDNECVIDESWYYTLTDYCKLLINQRIHNNFKLGNVIVPHAFQFDNECKFLNIMYKCYIDSFDYNIWYQWLVDHSITNIPNGVKMIYMNSQVKCLFTEMYHKNQPIDKNNDMVLQLMNDVAKNMDNGQHYFVRMSSTSGKNEKYVRPFNDASDIVSHIASMKLFVDQEYIRDKDSFIILIPWNDQIESKYEFRIFVVDNRLVAVSQQNSKELYNYSQKELKIIQHALNNITFINNGLYNTYVGDVYVDIINGICKLIEINPFGASSGAGAALFHWIDDYDLLHGMKQEVEFRYLSIINY